MKQAKRFYEKGIRFECQGSGKCCLARDDYGYVYVSLQDRKRLAAYLGITTHAFTRQYTEKTDGMSHLKNPEKDCPFFRKKDCIVYEARPQQCRAWPFWRENMTRRIWEREVAPHCPGVGKGRLYTADEIDEIIDKGKEVASRRSQKI